MNRGGRRESQREWTGARTFAVAMIVCHLILGVSCLVISGREEKEQAGPRQVAATVDNEAIDAKEVEREVASALKGQKLAGEALARLRKYALEQVIDRHLVLRYLEAQKQAASKQDVDFALARLVRQLKAKDTVLA